MTNKYNIKDTVWIHLGEPNLVQGRVVEIVTLNHLNEPGYIIDRELYVIEIVTHIDNIYEVREWETISPNKTGPINCFRNLGTETRKLKKLGIKSTQVNELEDFVEVGEPTADQINAALERSEQSIKHSAMSMPLNPKPKRRSFKKRSSL